LVYDRLESREDIDRAWISRLSSFFAYAIYFVKAWTALSVRTFEACIFRASCGASTITISIDVRGVTITASSVGTTIA
jgi:hypothetical protein